MKVLNYYVESWRRFGDFRGHGMARKFSKRRGPHGPFFFSFKRRSVLRMAPDIAYFFVFVFGDFGAMPWPANSPNGAACMAPQISKKTFCFETFVLKKKRMEF